MGPRRAPRRRQAAQEGALVPTATTFWLVEDVSAATVPDLFVYSAKIDAPPPNDDEITISVC
jgi:hypothetical protein